MKLKERYKGYTLHVPAGIDPTAKSIKYEDMTEEQLALYYYKGLIPDSHLETDERQKEVLSDEDSKADLEDEPRPSKTKRKNKKNKDNEGE